MKPFETKQLDAMKEKLDAEHRRRHEPSRTLFEGASPFSNLPRRLYSAIGRRSIPPEQLFLALVGGYLLGIPRDRKLVMEGLALSSDRAVSAGAPRAADRTASPLHFPRSPGLLPQPAVRVLDCNHSQPMLCSVRKPQRPAPRAAT